MERKKRKRDRKATTEQNTAQLALLLFLLTFFILFIFIYLFINYKLIFFFFGGVFCCCCCLFLFLPIFSLGFGVRTCEPVGGRVLCLMAVFDLRHVWRVGFEMEGSILAQCALGPLPFLCRHVSSNFCTIQGLNYTLMCSKI